MHDPAPSVGGAVTLGAGRLVQCLAAQDDLAMTFCTGCGARIGARFCSQCGLDTATASAPPPIGTPEVVRAPMPLSEQLPPAPAPTLTPPIVGGEAVAGAPRCSSP